MFPGGFTRTMASFGSLNSNLFVLAEFEGSNPRRVGGIVLGGVYCFRVGVIHAAHLLRTWAWLSKVPGSNHPTNAVIVREADSAFACVCVCFALRVACAEVMLVCGTPAQARTPSQS